MKLGEFCDKINSYTHGRNKDNEMVIEISLPYSTVGSIPSVGIKSIINGFDWDAGKTIIIPEKDLTYPNDEFVQGMKKLQDECGWLKYENGGLKREIKKLKKLLEKGNNE
jgi:hypothetical protein